MSTSAEIVLITGCNSLLMVRNSNSLSQANEELEQARQGVLDSSWPRLCYPGQNMFF